MATSNVDEDAVIADALREAEQHVTRRRSYRPSRLVLAAVAAALLLLALAWCYRWQVVPAERGVFYLLNRWTGEVRLVVPDGWTTLHESK